MYSIEHISKLYAQNEEKIQPELKTQETEQLTRQIIEATSELNNEITPVQKDKVEYILELRSEREGIYQEQVFIYAFSLAVQIILESLSKNTNIQE